MKDNNITMVNGNEVCINTTRDCSTCMIPKVGTCNHDRYHDYINKNVQNTGKAYKELKEFGLFKLMPNGFNVYLDDEDMVKSDDSYYAHLEYSLEENVYKTPNGITVTSEELMQSKVTFIGSDPMGDFEVPALWIIPNDAWYEKQKHIEK